MNYKFLIFLVFYFLFFVSGCKHDDKIKELQSEISYCYEQNNMLSEQKTDLQNKLDKISQQLQNEHNIANTLVYLIQNNQYLKAKKIIKLWKDKNLIKNDIKNIKEEKEFHNFIIKVIIFIIKTLVVFVLVSSLVFIFILIFKGKDIKDKLIKALGVIAFMILYWLASFYNISISNLMLRSTFSTSEIFSILLKDFLPFFTGLIFAILIKKQIEEGLYASRWLIIVSTLLFCTLLDVFINIKIELNNQSIPIANATFIVGLFMSLFFNIKPKEE